MTAIEKRANTFKEFLEQHNYYIDYNGLQYTLVTKSNDLIAVTNTPEEMYNFILGFNIATAIQEQRNLENIKNYEEIIKVLQPEEEKTK